PLRSPPTQATILCDVIVLHLLRKRSAYREAKFQQMEDEDAYKAMNDEEAEESELAAGSAGAAAAAVGSSAKPDYGATGDPGGSRLSSFILLIIKLMLNLDFLSASLLSNWLAQPSQSQPSRQGYRVRRVVAVAEANSSRTSIAPGPAGCCAACSRARRRGLWEGVGRGNLALLRWETGWQRDSASPPAGCSALSRARYCGDTRPARCAEGGGRGGGGSRPRIAFRAAPVADSFKRRGLLGPACVPRNRLRSGGVLRFSADPSAAGGTQLAAAIRPIRTIHGLMMKQIGCPVRLGRAPAVKAAARSHRIPRKPEPPRLAGRIALNSEPGMTACQSPGEAAPPSAIYRWVKCTNNTALIRFMQANEQRMLDQMKQELPAMLGLAAAFAVLIVAGGLANFLLAGALCSRRALRSNSHGLFVLNLACSDLLLCLITQPLNLMQLLQSQYGWPYGEPLCKAASLLTGLNLFVSTFSVSAVALERFRVGKELMTSSTIVHPSAGALPILRCRVVVLGIWALGLLMASPMALMSQ
uniref:G_PROTEIN_RECEP_F1_2 domain-containing protein n=1 Tax=Macrostomum lignano TaxID=282301 RepID=A0A1I8IXL5_9PLAT